MKEHAYTVRMTWTGNDGEGTKTYRGYRRDHAISVGEKTPILGSSDPAFRGDPARYSPEELLVASLSSCHMLWYLHLCAVNQIVVVDYRDVAIGRMRENDDGAGEFAEVILNPEVRLSAGSDTIKAAALHEEAHRFCFIARSVKFPVRAKPQVTAG